MPIYHVALSVRRPPNHGDAEMVALLQQTANEAACVVIEITAIGLIVECEAGTLKLLEIGIRSELAARGGSLEQMVARPI